MDPAAYEDMARLEQDHWWFSARRRILQDFLASHFASEEPHRHILEAGCGTGGNLAMLASFGKVDAFEFNAQARLIAQEKSGFTIPFGALPHQIPFPRAHYDLIALLDVLEHIEDDTATLLSLASHLKPKGRLLLTVPAYPALWSAHDERHHHLRRYTKHSLMEVIAKTPLTVHTCTYFNTLLFPLAVGARMVKKLRGDQSPDEVMPSPLMNRALKHSFALERHALARQIPLPFGLSLLALLEHP